MASFGKEITQPIEWLDNKLRILDQSKLPREQSFVDLVDYRDIALAIT